MELNAAQIVEDILTEEGGFVNNASDHGGATNFGITQHTLSEWRGYSVSEDEVRNLSRAEAREIYRSQYITVPGFIGIEDGRLAALVVDSGVQHGVDRASRWLQEAAGVAQDGIVGPITIKAVMTRDPAVLRHKIMAMRAEFYGQIISHDHSQAQFALGWARRLAKFIQAM